MCITYLSHSTKQRRLNPNLEGPRAGAPSPNGLGHPSQVRQHARVLQDSSSGASHVAACNTCYMFFSVLLCVIGTATRACASRRQWWAYTGPPARSVSWTTTPRCHTHTHTHTHIRIHTHIHTHTHTHILYHGPRHQVRAVASHACLLRLPCPRHGLATVCVYVCVNVCVCVCECVCVYAATFRKHCSHEPCEHIYTYVHIYLCTDFRQPCSPRPRVSLLLIGWRAAPRSSDIIHHTS